MTKKIWFKNKSYGCGWTPATKEGWLVIFIFCLILIIAEVFIFKFIKDEAAAIFAHISFIILWSIALVFISYKKGEKVEWRWNGKKINFSKKRI